ncbi:hypothetical protein HNY73_007309 [Argiope bruennichi]|uniref:Mutator-like transposase domain-containing protein n=1 Tax=Argiope bruennichi TaxID=94029 RepID=A0A8T0FIL3_ARGBR|nr:hypothetical protein HNY73_007309 [Argiope bruennichi]
MVEKLECIGHVQKRIGARLKTLKNKLKSTKLADGKKIAGRGRLTDAEILLIHKYSGLAIRRNASMSKSIWAIYFHKLSTNAKPQHVFRLPDFYVIRQTVSQFYARNEVSSLRTLLPAVKEKTNFPWKVKTLRCVLQKIGFKWKRSVDKRKIVMERPDIVQWRYSVGSSTRLELSPNCWETLDRCHPRNQDGFIEGASLVFQSGTAKGDNHGQMNYDNFSKWLQEKLLPNIPPHCVICMDNASYPTKVLNPVPSKYSTKKKLSEWLEEHNIPFDVNMRKPDLYDLVVSHVPPSKMFCVDEILKANGHDVLRIPPYHCDLNAIEMAWASTKRHVRNRNVNGELNITTLRDPTINGLLNVTKNEWKSF